MSNGRLQLDTALSERYQCSNKALVLAMVAHGMSTRKVRRVIEELCGREFSRSAVSRLCEALDEKADAWAQRELGRRRYPFVLIDALQIEVRRHDAFGPRVPWWRWASTRRATTRFWG